jgi:hypothetical protein
MENDTNNEVVASQTDTEEVVTETTGAETEEVSTQEESEVDVAKLQETNKKLFERAKKAEADLKALKANKPAKTVETSVSPQLNVEEAVLQANGMSDELLTELKAVAKVRGLSLIKAQNDPIFVAVKEKFEQDKKQKDASLPASRGSGSAKPKKDLTTPGLSREEHRKLALGL